MKVDTFSDHVPCSLVVAFPEIILKVLAASITLMMEKPSTSGTSINFYQTTWCNGLEDSCLHDGDTLMSE
jgi:hypothetical protein